MSRSRVPGDPGPLPRIEELETARGPRVATSAGERLMVVLAAVVLLAGVLIGVANLLPDAPATAEASPRQTASATPRPTPSPRPTPTPPPLRELALQPGSPSAPMEVGPAFPIWLRARVDLPLRALRDERSARIGTLAAGEVVRADAHPADPDWVSTDRGYLHLGRDPDAWVDMASGFGGPFARDGGFVRDIVVGPDRVVVQTWRDAGGFGEASLWVSDDDGRSWRRVGLPSSPRVPASVAFGPSGWLLAAAAGNGNLDVWRSDDAVHWEFAGVLSEATPMLMEPEYLLGSDVGYLLRIFDRFRARTSLWYSPDGRTWLETEWPGPERGIGRLMATPLGFYAAASDDPRAPTDGSAGWWLGEGRRWRAVSEGPTGGGAWVVPLGDGLLGLDARRGATRRTWVGTVVDRTLTWRQPDEPAGSLPDDVVVNSLGGNGERALLAGWRDGSPVLYETDGRKWRPLAVPAGEGVSGWLSIGAVTSEGAVLVERRATLHGDFAVLWSQLAGGRWREAREQPFAIPQPSGKGCPSLPTTAFDFMLLDPADAVVCFGDEPISFPAWAEPCSGCPRVDGSAHDWLTLDHDNVLYLMPIELPEPFGAYPVVLHPDAVVPDELEAGWLQLTGHFADPAADPCRDVPAEAPYPQDLSLVYQCQRTFVVTSAEPVPGS
ncbi:MAG TPA: hypothetical protein VFH63_05275 [candidate division Zixibacteria bacterium]|nr:hypothetical protein [candidate division Zixibacteria bacterium]